MVVNGVTTRHTISNGETIRPPLPPGEQTLAMKIDWTGSKPLTLSLRSGELCHLRVELSGDMFSTDRYLRLTRQG